MLLNKINNPIIFILTIVLISSVSSSRSYGGELKVGSIYKTTKPIFIRAEYRTGHDYSKEINKKTAVAYLSSVMLAKRRFTLWRTEIPPGTVMTIVDGPIQKDWYQFFSGDTYFVRLEPDPSRGLSVVILLDRGLEGSLDGLNPEIFSRLPTLKDSGK